MTELVQMLQARNKLTALIHLQEKLEYGLIEADAEIYGLTQAQIDARMTSIQAKKQELITELVTMLNNYLGV